MVRVAAALAIFVSIVWAQAPASEKPAPEKPALQNAGKPMRVEFTCTEDDMLSAGMSCSEEEPCPVYLELSAAEGVGEKVFAAGNLHSAQATLYSILLASEDGGKTWREPFERRHAASLDRIQFVDFETGWISGQILQPLPRDPFFLITSDGGKTWRERPVFSDTRGGSIQQFWFESPTNGSMLITDGPRYEYYESPNGGEAWLVREVSERPIRWKPRGTASPTIRVRADGPTKSFRLERRQDSNWTVLASFSIAAGSCAPVPREMAPPPEAPSEEALPESPPQPAQPRRPARPPTLKRPPK